ncbi:MULTISPECIES: helix-turn-helix domain-containing protein [Bradyrhizobium]|jgi:AraC-like DNA-binding protein|uniref:Transcriptional regulator, AraC family n=2 Tax=Bradyrhizobium TaxID=374 RepID=A0ABY0PLN3_9BRAD|nr:MULTISPECIES: AraC family transcriptional regulator [Bradyrhizobium]SDI61017.1 transcriptional regulator, AraC family [Bradyrhizobium ottawaense]SED36551.1 transcriptional regulator, AraC family [Bradyrhizobium lablabi]SHL38449.1 transcriptional regulator, AraC family [Bradyrhizobium lablabi]
MDDIGHKSGHKSGHLMLITPERVFYAGLLGRPRARRSGAFNVYVAIEGGLWLTTADGRETFCELAAVLPNDRHTIASDYRSVLSLVIEPESVPSGVFEDLVERLSGPESEAFANRIRAAYVALRERQGNDDISNAEFDSLCLGEALPRRALDPRVARSIVQIGKFCGEPVTAASCAVEAGLSPSRFLHLFKEETGISFRSFRAWKRARHLLHFANQDINLAHLAQDIGYPDSTHFSHSIRRFYGLKPRAIFSGSRDLAIYTSGRTEADNSAWTQEAS